MAEFLITMIISHTLMSSNAQWSPSYGPDSFPNVTGRCWSDHGDGINNITKICIKAGVVIEGIQVWSGTPDEITMDPLWAGREVLSNGTISCYEPASDDCFNGISGAAGDAIDRLQFTTKNGFQSQIWGGPGGSSFHFQGSSKDCIKQISITWSFWAPIRCISVYGLTEPTSNPSSPPSTAPTIDSRWRSGTPSMPVPLRQSSIGYYQDTIYIIGGLSADQQLTEYNMSTNTFKYYATFFGVANQAYSHSWVQLGEILYMTAPYNELIHIFNLRSKQSIPSAINTLDFDGDMYSRCLAGSSEQKLLYYLGGRGDWSSPGYYRTLEIFNMSDNEWNSGPLMNEQRGFLSCITSSNEKLYAIGGENDDGDLYTIEYIHTGNIYNNSWIYLDDQLTPPSHGIRTVKYQEYLFVIPGLTDKVHIIDTITERISILPGHLSSPVSDAMPIIANDTIYVFGGLSLGASSKVWQTYSMLSALYSSVFTAIL